MKVADIHTQAGKRHVHLGDTASTASNKNSKMTRASYVHVHGFLFRRVFPRAGINYFTFIEEPYRSMADRESGSRSTKNSLFGEALSSSSWQQDEEKRRSYYRPHITKTLS